MFLCKTKTDPAVDGQSPREKTLLSGSRAVPFPLYLNAMWWTVERHKELWPALDDLLHHVVLKQYSSSTQQVEFTAQKTGPRCEITSLYMSRVLVQFYIQGEWSLSDYKLLIQGNSCMFFTLSFTAPKSTFCPTEETWWPGLVIIIAVCCTTLVFLFVVVIICYKAIKR